MKHPVVRITLKVTLFKGTSINYVVKRDRPADYQKTTFEDIGDILTDTISKKKS